MLDLKLIGKNIQQYRKQQGLSQDELANKLYLSRQAISRWEMGLSAPTIDNMIELTQIFQVSFEDLLGLDCEVAIEKEDIFKHHDRVYVMDCLCHKKVNFKLGDIFNQLTSAERYHVLYYQLFHFKRIDADIKQVLDDEELEFVEKGEKRYEI